MCTLNLLQGTRYMPSLAGAVLFLEDDELSSPTEFRRDLHSLLQLPDAAKISGLVIGRFQQASGINREDLSDLVATIPVLAGKPVLANVDFGHTNPLMTIPIGGPVRVLAEDDPKILIDRH